MALSNKASRRKVIEPHLKSIGNLRPIFTSLNGDHSWLMSFPRPASEAKEHGKAFFHIVYEPWLEGGANFLPSFLINITMTQNPAIKDAAAVEDLVQEIEELAAQRLGIDRTAASQNNKDGYTGGIDLILLCFDFRDHVHEATLRKFDPRIPVLASRNAERAVTSWNHFKNIEILSDMPFHSRAWQLSEKEASRYLPTWLTTRRLLSDRPLNCMLAIVWTRLANVSNLEKHEAILIAAHGVQMDNAFIQAFLKSEPETIKLAMLHNLKDSFAAGAQNTFGAKSGLALYRALDDCDYWIATHDGQLSYTGIILRLLFTADKPRTLEWALAEEEAERIADDKPKVLRRDPTITRVDNGGSLVLV